MCLPTAEALCSSINYYLKVVFSPIPRSSFLISLLICDLALMCNSCPLFDGRPLSSACTVWVGG